MEVTGTWGRSYAQVTAGASTAGTVVTGTATDVKVVVGEACGEEEEVVEITSLLLTPEFTSIAQLLQYPHELEDDWNPSTAMARCLPKKCVQDIGLLEAELKDLQAMVDLQTRKVVLATPADTTATGRKVEALQKKI